MAASPDSLIIMRSVSGVRPCSKHGNPRGRLLTASTALLTEFRSVTGLARATTRSGEPLVIHRHCHARALATALSLLLCLPASTACASWATDGNPVVGSASSPTSPVILPSVNGSVFLAWIDGRSGYNTDIRASLWTTAGLPTTGWIRDGSLVTNITCAKYESCAVPDGTGGAILAWSDDRCTGARQIYARRVAMAGPAAAGWPEHGVRLAATTANQFTPAVCSDGAGGAFVAWQDLRAADADIYLQHVDGAGAVARGWPSAGLAVAVAPGTQAQPVLVRDAGGGVFVAWQDRRAGNHDVYLQHVTGEGTLAPGWTASGVAIVAPGDQGAPSMIPDGTGGVFLAWQDHRGSDWDIYALRVQGNATLAPGWSANGNAVCQASGDQLAVRAAADGAGGAFLVWQDRRGGVDWDVYATHLGANASVFDGWLVGGAAISAAVADQTAPDLAGDESGGVYLTWQDRRSGGADIRALHLTNNRSVVAGWRAGGSLLCGATGDQSAPRIAGSGTDAYVVWADARSGAIAPELYAQRIVSAGPIQVRPIGITAIHHDGQTFLTWNPPPDTGWTHRVYFSLKRIATDAELASATLLGSVRDSSATDRRLSSLTGIVCTFRPDSAAAPLAPEQGLFVVTVPASRLGFYAVTSQLFGGPEDRHVMLGGNALTNPAVESLAEPRPVFQRRLTRGATTSDVYTLWTWPQDTPLFPAMSNRPSWPYDCGVTHGAPGGPAFVRPHQRGGSFTEQLLASGSPAEWVLGLDDYFLNSDVQSYWYGYHPSYDFLSESNFPPTSGEVVDYTNRRVLHTIRWWRRTFAFDTTRHYAFGYSLGGTYSLHLGLAHPELFVAAMSSAGKVDFSLEDDPEPLSSFNSGQPFRESLSKLWGTTATNLTSSEGLPVYAVMNDASLAALAVRDGAAFLVNFAGRHDLTVGWTEKRGFYSALEASRLGGIQYWDDRDHTGRVIPGAFSPMLDLRYLYRFRSNLSWPAFSRCSTNGDPGQFTSTSGDSIGTLNGYPDWDPALLDSSTRWRVVLRTRGLTTLWGALPAPESLTVDVTPRRVQRFRPPAGTTATWVALRSSDGAVVQRGSVTVDRWGLVTIPAVKTYRTGTTLTLTGQAGGLAVPPLASHSGALSIAPFRNPARGPVALAVQWPESGRARLTLYDTSGRRVLVLCDAPVSPGDWRATADLAGLAAGVYLVRAEQAGASSVRRLVLLR